jgi:thiosulfate dehydrogenase (quinone) large subunit
MVATVTSQRSTAQTVLAGTPESPTKAGYAWAAARISLGWVFLWAFLDKTFALGFATGRDPATGAIDRFGDAAWINGASPASGFLNFGTEGKIFHDFFAGLAGPVTDWMFMLALLGIGLALTLGIGMRIAAISATVLLLSMWAAELRLDNNPFMDDHIVYATVIIGLALAGAGRTLGLGRWWESTSIVQRFPILQ